MSNKNLSKPEAYPPSAITVYDVISSYLVDIYYNHFYGAAIKFRDEKRVPSITDGYKHAIYAFIEALNNKEKKYNPKHYTKILNGINDYFRTYTSYTAIGVSECIDKIIREFVPIDYYPHMTKEQKRTALHEILMTVIKEFSKMVVAEYLGDIIDRHEQIENVEILKDHMIDLFKIQRDLLYRRFLNTKINPKGDVVDRELAVKMREDVSRLSKENKILADKATNAATLLSDRDQQLKKLIEGYRKMKYELVSARTECDSLKNTNSQQTSEIKRLKEENAKLGRANTTIGTFGMSSIHGANSISNPITLSDTQTFHEPSAPPLDDDDGDDLPASKILEKRKTQKKEKPSIPKEHIKDNIKDIFNENNTSLDEY